MRFYYENYSGDSGYFSEKELIKAIYTAWNIDADLWLLNDGVNKLKTNEYIENQGKLVFCPFGKNDFNSEILKEFGYYMVDGTEFREIRRISDDFEIKYDWSKVKQLV